LTDALSNIVALSTLSQHWFDYGYKSGYQEKQHTLT
jgi:hypothetical protein